VSRSPLVGLIADDEVTLHHLTLQVNTFF
jgi:hypothetical protein